MKITANTTVIIIPNSVPRRLPSINEWCAYVTLAPDDRSRIVFSNGISNGFNGSIPAGGQALPNSTVGAKAEWKSIYSSSRPTIRRERGIRKVPARAGTCPPGYAAGGT